MSIRRVSHEDSLAGVRESRKARLIYVEPPLRN